MGLATAIAAGAIVGGSVLSAKSANKQSKRAAQVSQDNTAANNQIIRENRDFAAQRIDPFAERGNAAGDALNALLGLRGTQQQFQQQQVQPNALSQFRPGGAGSGFGIGDFQAGLGGPAQVQTTAQPALTPQQAQEQAFENFRNSSGFQFRLNEGMDALNSGFAGAGVLQSGDAMRSAVEFGQNLASNEFGNFTNLLANQQQVGLSGANALAGVSTNAANNLTVQNTQNAANQANALLSRQNPLANGLGALGSGLFGFGNNAVGGFGGGGGF